MASSCSTPPIPKTILKPRLGGCHHLERLLGLVQNPPPFPADAVFVSLDLQVTEQRKHLRPNVQPTVTQLGFAYLDSKHIDTGSDADDDLISVRYLRVAGVGLSKTAKSKIKKRPCVFAEAQKITQDQVRTTIIRNLQIHDEKNGSLRNIVLVGHSIKEDLKVLHLLDINPMECAPLVSVIDTHVLARHILPPFSPGASPQPGQDFSLKGVLSEFGVLPGPAGLCNAGNEAVYALYALLVLVIRRANDGPAAELSQDAQKRVEALMQVTLPDRAF